MEGLNLLTCLDRDSVRFFRKPDRPIRFFACRMYEDRFDFEHCKNVAPEIERMILRSYSSIVLSEESKKKILDLGTSTIMYTLVHKSHFDYIAICVKMCLEGLPYPRTIAGDNLLRGIRGMLTKHLAGIDMMKLGTIPIKRDSLVSRDLLKVCSQIEKVFRSDRPVLVFPEVEAVSNGDGSSIKTGRAYSGKIRKFASALFSPAIKISKEGKKVYIAPISVSYDFVAEDGYFGSLAKADKMKKSQNALACFAGMLYYTFLECHFFYKMYSLGKGNIYIDIGQPFLVEPHSSKKELARRVQEEAARCYRVTMPALVSYAISKGSTSREALQKFVERYSELLMEANTHFEHSANLKESIEGALHDLEQRKIISNYKGISVKAPEIICYYANTIAHHFRQTGRTP